MSRNLGPATWPAWASRVRVYEALAEAVEPDDLSPNLHRLGKQRDIGGYREAESRLHKVGAEARRVGRMRCDRREIGHEFGGANGNPEGFGHLVQQARLDVRRPVLAVGPERELEQVGRKESSS